MFYSTFSKEYFAGFQFAYNSFFPMEFALTIVSPAIGRLIQGKRIYAHECSLNMTCVAFVIWGQESNGCGSVGRVAAS